MRDGANPILGGAVLLALGQAVLLLPQVPRVWFALALLAAGGALLGGARGASFARQAGGIAMPALPPPGSAARTPWILRCWVALGVLLAIGLCYELHLVLAILSGRALQSPFAEWILAIAAVGLALLLRDRWVGRSLKDPLTASEWVVVLALMAACSCLYLADIDSYKFAFIGDEFAFFAMARDLVRGTVHWDNIFSEQGIWGYHPRLSSLYQAAFMRLLGAGNLGWKSSSIFAAIACLPPLYILLKAMISGRAAFWGTCMFAFSHYGMAFAHIGYNNNHVLFPLIASYCFYFWGERHGSGLGFFLSGVAAGLGFYTFHTSRLVVALVLLLFLLSFSRAARRAWWFALCCFLLGFLLATAPFLADARSVLENLRQLTVLGDAHHAGAVSPWLLVGRNISLALLSPVYFNLESHFVSGTVLDVVTSSFYVVGFFVCLFQLGRSRTARFLLLQCLLPAFAIGITTPYDSPPATRMLFMVPVSCLVAALGADRLLALLESKPRGGRLFARGAGALLLAAMVGLNVYRLQVLTPERNGVSTESLVVRYLQRAPRDGRYYYLLPDEWGRELIDAHIELYGLKDKVQILHFRDAYERPQRLTTPCTLLFNQDQPQERDGLIRSLKGEGGPATLRTFWDPGRLNSMSVLVLP